MSLLGVGWGAEVESADTDQMGTRELLRLRGNQVRVRRALLAIATANVAGGD